MCNKESTAKGRRPETGDKTMHIQKGNYYITRIGELVGPMENSAPDNAESGSPWYAKGLGLYRANGEFGYGSDVRSLPLDITETVDDAARRCIEGA
jgi:hypothetical protein